MCNNFSISFASEVDFWQVFIFDFSMIVDDSIMDEEYFLILVVVWVTVSFVNLTTCCPSGVGNSHCGVDWLFGEFIHQFLYAVHSWWAISLLCKLAYHLFDFVVFFSERHNTCTVVTSIFEQLYSVAEKSLDRSYIGFFGIRVRFGLYIGCAGDDTKYSATLWFLLLLIVKSWCSKAS